MLIVFESSGYIMISGMSIDIFGFDVVKVDGKIVDLN